MKEKFTIASFFAGVGGIDLGFEKTGFFKTVYANEIDPYPVKTFEKNFSLKVDDRDIKNVKAEDIPNVDIITGGFPCQAFSIAGYQKGFLDEKGRGQVFFELIRIINSKKPRIVFLENVKNLVSHDKGNTFRIVLAKLEEAGYQYHYQVLNAKDYGNTPQNRERIYIVAFKNKKDYEKFNFPKPIALTKTLEDVIDFSNKLDDKYYYTPNKYKGDIHKILEEAMDEQNAVYQWRRKYARKNKSGVVPTLTANMGEGGHNVPLVKTKHGIRKMTPSECFNSQGFPADFKLPQQTDSRLYKQAGNSVCVNVINQIANNILEVLK
ncbi:DNA cytosine methyltransferase [Mycoplasmopsis agassizii]|uniref:Cytosine-specific methyltransferase n=1 Tax=Mycoplasmopsis agassizii TaxID=33922 RepID=A0ABX4H5F6_9BACT|nr:DNA cytosine methyltransferase [Mycoplasmopsis agassizii]PAF55088.1 DNA cytosine methyltransferase [Mycoplasmopsis agassizii]SMC19158.1 DNA (cytosine-5)-methyltransferase 1 [Mycoplasmopsis agassizii]